jgi:hypothetical protein
MRGRSPAVERERRAPRGALLAALAVLAASTALAASPALALRGEIEQREGLLTWLALAGLFVGAVRSHAGAEARERTLDAIVLAASLAAGYALVQFAGFDPFAWSGAATYTGGGSGVLRPAPRWEPILLGAVLAPALLSSRRGSRPAAAIARCRRRAAVLACTLAATLSRGADRWRRGVVVSVALVRPAWPRLAFCARRAAAARAGVERRGASGAARAACRGRGGQFGAGAPRHRERGAAAEGASARGWARGPMVSGSRSRACSRSSTGSTSGWACRRTRTRRRCNCSPPRARSACSRWPSGRRSLCVRSPRRRACEPGRTRWQGSGARSRRSAWRRCSIRSGSPGPPCWWCCSPYRRRAKRGRRRRRRRGRAPLSQLWRCWRWPRAWPSCSTGARRAARARRSRRRQSLPATSAPAAGAALRPRTMPCVTARETDSWRLAGRALCGGPRCRAGQMRSTELARAAERAAREAVALQPLRAANRLRLADALALRAQLEPGQRDALSPEAFAEFGAAARLAPADALVLVNRSRAALVLGLAPDALESARTMIRMYPAAATGHALEGAALLALGRRDEARAALGRALSADWEEGSEQQRRAAASLHEALGRP